MSSTIRFPKPLQKARVIDRPNRYVANVELLDGSRVRCYTPVGGRIGGFTIDGMPCLISGPHEGRKTVYTLEALGFTNQWVGINQNTSNGFVEEFLRRGLLNGLHGDEAVAFQREVSLGSSRLDLKLDSATQHSWVEIKTPLIKIHAVVDPGIPLKIDYGSQPPSNRMPKQLNDMLSLRAQNERAILLGVFLYRNEIGTAKERYLANLDLDGLSTNGAAQGLESWALTLYLDENGVTFENLNRIC